jgi:hypothetical protein
MLTIDNMSDRETRSVHGNFDPSHSPSRQRPESFSTYASRRVVRRLKVIAAIRDVPLWSVVADALDLYLDEFERRHGALPHLAESSDMPNRSKG